MKIINDTLGKSWKTTAVGLGLAVLTAYQTGAFTDPAEWKLWLMPVLFAAFGYLAKDHNVTGAP